MDLRFTAQSILAGVLFVLTQQTATAAMATFSDFDKITNNNVENLSSQLSITVYDSTEANSTFGLIEDDFLDTNQILFTVQNAVGITSSVAEVYFDDSVNNGLTGPSTVLNSLGGSTNFSGGGASPSNLPGGNTIGFNATTILSADVNPGPPSNGVNTSTDILGIVMGRGTYSDFQAVVDAINTGDLRLGLHVRSIGAAGGSDGYANTVVPLPASFWLFGPALLGLIGMARKR